MYMNKTTEKFIKFLNKKGYDYYFNQDKYGHAFILYGNNEEHNKIEKEWCRLCDLKTADVSNYDINFYYDDDSCVCSDCGMILNASNYDKPDYYIDYEAGEVYCKNCVKKNPENYLDYLVNNSTRANVLLSDLELKENGFTKIEGIYENGLYEGMDDDPEDILKELSNTYKNIIFSISTLNPFMTQFEVWNKEE